MSKKNSEVKSILAVIFVIFLVVEFFKNDSFRPITSYVNYLKQQDYEEEDAGKPEEIENDYISGLWKFNDYVSLNARMAKVLHMGDLYSDMGMYMTDDRYIVTSSPETSGDYEVEQVIGFRDFLEKNGINFIYVNEPTKYIDDDLFRRQFGVETYSNRNVDHFLERIREAGVNTIDLRENIKEEGLNSFDLFFRTDHHWTPSAALWAAGKMAEGLNEYCGYDIDLSVYDEDNFEKTEWKEAWLGEQGKKMGEPYAGLEDYTELKPKFKTDYTFKLHGGGRHRDTFDYFIDESMYDTESDVYDVRSWHYAYKDQNCINNKVKKGKVLLIGDSYDVVTHPFLSLQVHELDTMILREHGVNFHLENYIKKKGYDTVIVAYAQFMLGAHDDEENSNYKLFILDR